MAVQPKPQTPPPAPKPAPPKPADPKPDAKTEGGAPEPVRDEREDPDNPDHNRGRDKKTGKIPGTPTTPPEGHDHAEPPLHPVAKQGEPDPPVKTVADEQRARSADMQGEGMQAWKDEHDERDPDEKPKVVPGIQHRPVEEHEARSSR